VQRSKSWSVLKLGSRERVLCLLGDGVGLGLDRLYSDGVGLTLAAPRGMVGCRRRRAVVIAPGQVKGENVVAVRPGIGDDPGDLLL
jgi:hypothetical protein